MLARPCTEFPSPGRLLADALFDQKADILSLDGAAFGGGLG